MLGCTACQEHLLDHLYDLLDEAEQATFLDHLAGCPTCQAALAKARAQQSLLARAARLHFPDVTFTPPTDAVTPPAPAPAAERRWVNWALAATVLLALGGLAAPAYRAQRDYQAALTAVRDHEDALNDSLQTAMTSAAALEAAREDHAKNLAAIDHESKARELRLVVTGPKTVQPGAPAEFQVRAFDLNGQPADADLYARFDDALKPGEGGASRFAMPARPDVATGSGSANFAKAKDAAALDVSTVAKGVYKVRIPPTTPLPNRNSLGMVVEARKRGEPGRELVSLHGQVTLTSPVYLTHLTTDKPIYQPGETLRYRSLTLERDTLTPPAEAFHLSYTLTDPLGSTHQLSRGTTTLLASANKPRSTTYTTPATSAPDQPQGVGAGEWPLDGNLPGGEYTLTVSEDQGRFTPVTRKFTVNRYQKPLLDKKLDFNRSSYGPGDEVQVKVNVRRANGGPAVGALAELTPTIDGKTYGHNGQPAVLPLAGVVEADGGVVVRFTLPKAIDRGQGSVAVKVTDGGVVDTLVRPLPIVLKKLEVEFFPEGGDLVAGLPSRVYFSARTMLGKPAQLRGTLLEDGKPLPGVVETLSDDDKPGANQGVGVFAFTPAAGKKYAVRIDTPEGVVEPKPLPTVAAAGVALKVDKGVFEAAEPIRVQVTSTRGNPLVVGAYCRGQLLDTVELPAGVKEATLKPTTGTGGVCRITVFEELPSGQTQRTLQPVAERLVYRHPKERLDVSITADQRQYVPGQKATLSVATTTEAETLTPAWALVRVVDKSVLVMADEKTYRSMPTHFLLTTEVRRAEDLEYADFLLGSHPKAALALDMLLGTQGWRRFAEQNPQDFLERQRKQGEAGEAERLLVMIGQSAPRTTDFDREKRERVDGEFREAAQALAAKKAEADLALMTARNREEYQTAKAAVVAYEKRWEGFRDSWMSAVAVVVLVVLLLAGLIAALANRTKPALSFVGVALACGLLLVVSWPRERGEFATREAVAVGPRMEVKTPAAARRGMEPERIAPMAEKAVPNDAVGDKDAAVEKAVDGPMIAGGMGGIGLGGGGFDGGKGGALQPGAGGMMMMQRAGLGAPGGEAKGKPAAKGGRPAAMDDAERFAEMAKLKDGNKANLDRLNFEVDKKKRLGDEKGEAKEEAIGGRRRMAMDRAEFGFGGRLAGKEMAPATAPLVYREYAHLREKPAEGDALRRDFTETLFWHPILPLADGRANVSFDLCDSVTSFEVTVFAHTTTGRLGSATKVIDSRLPFTLAAKVPTEITSGDRIDVPIAMSNHTKAGREVDLRLTENEGLEVLGGKLEDRLTLPADGKDRRVVSMKANLQQGQASFGVEGRTTTFSDGVRETIRVVPDGFPMTGASGDLLEKSASHTVTLPEYMPGTLDVRLDVYPSTLADLQKGLEGLLREPSGCFEQSSTSNYPNVLILDYLKTSDQTDPALEKKTRDLLASGYKKLTSFECQDGGSKRGYEWFGGTAPPHEALTAYGLLQFRDMAKVSDVDRAMLERTRAYLMSQRDGKGGFKRNPRALDTFGRAPDVVTNAYIVWALTESGDDEVTAELDALAKAAKTADDPYFLSLVSLGLANRNRKAEAAELLRKVVARQKETGEFDGAGTSITGSGGRDLTIETTALAILGLLKTDPLAFDPPLRKAIRWVGQQRGGAGAFGSTQATILALKALIAWTKANKRTPEAGELRLFVGDQQVAFTSFAAGVDKPLTLTVPDAEKRLKVGANKLRAEITGAQNVFPHTLSWTCRTRTPPSAKDVKVKLEATLAKATLAEGDATRLTVKVQNVSGQNQGMAVAIVGLPAGLIVPEDLKQLKEHVRLPADGSKPLVGAFEVNGRELVLYWRDMAKDQTIEVPIDLIARVPGVYRGPASRAYLYYNADHKHWVEPLTATITAPVLAK